MLLLHGFPQHWYAWRHVMSTLADDRHLIAVDLPGFGWSEPSIHGYSTAERARSLIELLDVLRVDVVDLVGHDWGAWLAFRVALDAPQRVGRMVAISEIHPWPLQRRLVPNVWRMWVTALFEVPGLGSLVQGSQRVLRWFLSRDAADAPVWTDELVAIYTRRAGRRGVARAGQQLHSAFVLHDIARLVLGRDRTWPFHSPTLLLGGSRDRYIPPSLLTPPPARKSALRVHTIHGGHFILDENPADLIPSIHSHLHDQDPDPRVPPATTAAPITA